MRVNKVLITGGAGFIGYHVATNFASVGADVVVLDNLSRETTLKSTGGSAFGSNWAALDEIKGLTKVRGSVLNAELLRRLVTDVDLVIHLAGQVAVTSSLVDPFSDFETNCVGTVNVLEAVRQARGNCTVIFASTNKVYGDNVDIIELDEGATRYIPRSKEYARGISESLPVDQTTHSPYGTSKLAADLYAQEYGRTYGLNCGVFRMSCIYGPNQFGVADQGWVAHFVLSALRRHTLTIYGNGKQVRDVLYVDDLVDAYRKFAESGLGTEVFNIGGGPDNTLSLLELIRVIEEETGHRIVIQFQEWRVADQRYYVSDIGKVGTKLNWAPKTDPNTGLAKLQNWAEGALGL